MNNVEVIDENNVKREYFVKFKEKDFKENYEIYKPKVAEKIVAYIMIFLILLFTVFFMHYVFKIINAVPPVLEEELSPVWIKKISVIFLCIYTFISFLLISLLFYLVNRSDCGIRFAKLNELHNLRKSVLLDFSDKVKTENIKEIETEQIQTSIPSDLNKSNVSNVNINYNLPAKNSTKEKNLYSEFLKNYMNAVVEI